jgi:aminopeptidase S
MRRTINKNFAARFAALALVLMAFTATGLGNAPSYSTESYSRLIGAVAKGTTSKERGAAIRERLEEIGVKFTFEPFSAQTRGGREVSGWNIIAELPNPEAKRSVMLGAHYDRVAVGIGAVDNASGSVAVLELLNAFKKDPLKNTTLRVAFWDLEEVGLLGSRHYVEAHSKGGLPDIYINFDVFGYGDTLWLWSPQETSDFAASFETSAKAQKFGSRVSKIYPPSDHLSFNVPNVRSYSFSLLGAAEIENLIKLVSGQQVAQEDFPRVMRVIHTKEDSLEAIDASAVVRSLPVVEAAIRGLDK